MKISYILKEGYNATSGIFYFSIEDEVTAALEIPAITTIEIVDPGEGSTVYIPQLEYRVGEDKDLRSMVGRVQNLGDSFSCTIEKVCCFAWLPKYSPDNQEYGCLADSPSLLYRFTVELR
ncbi:hypothetical protein Q9233_012034 [Columba guinea]|nr:hypothetical protein Q9233_012034 [Columba guinea]